MNLQILVFLLSLIASSSCLEKTKPIEFSVRALNERNKPILNAQIYINKNFEGHSNSQGFFVLKREVNIDERVLVEIKKDSDKFYYAPYFENLVLKKDQNKVSIRAVLYSVPKPGLELSERKDKNIVKAETDDTKNAEVTKTEETVVEKTDTQLEEKVEEQKLADSTKVETPPAKEAEIVTPKEEEIKVVKNKANEVELEESPAVIQKKRQDKKDNKAKESTLTFYIKAKKKNLKDVDIFYGTKLSGQFKKGCTTGRNGRCSFRKSFQEGDSFTVLAKSEKHKTFKKTYQFKEDQRKFHISLKRGNSIDVFALSSHYGFRHGLEDIRVAINGKNKGRTDEFGHFTADYKGSIGDLVEINLNSRENLPELFSTDYIIDGNMTLVKFFGSTSPDPVRVLTVPIQVAGRLKGKTLSTFTGDLDRKIHRSLSKNFFTAPGFTKISSKNLKKHPGNWLKKIKHGWQDLDIKSDVDAVLVPTVVVHDPMQLEIKMIDSTGKTLAAAKSPLKNFSDRAAVSSSIIALSKKLVRNFPFEGTITDAAAEDDVYTINLGFGEGRGIKSGDVFDIYGLQTDTTGKSKSHRKVGKATVISTREYTSKIKINSKSARAVIDIGSKIVFRGAPTKGNGRLSIFVKDPDSNKGLTQANVYFKGKWLGATNKKGFLTVQQHIKDRGLLKVIKHGYETLTKETRLGRKGRMEIPLRQVTAFLKIDSEPSNLSVFLDKTFLGKTPFVESIPVPSGFAKLEILGENGFKNYKEVLDLDEGTLDLTGDKKIIMEKDYLSVAREMINSGRFQDAVKQLDSIPKDHSDYKQAQHKAGVVYMTLIQEPSKAAKAFYNVTSDTEVQSFRDKRFIGSHVNEGVSLHLTGKDLENNGDDEAAVAHYAKSVEVLNKVKPQLRFVKKDNYQQAFDNVYYYKALSHQSIWSLNKSLEHLLLAQEAWQTLIDTRRSKSSENTLVKNANIYLKQVEVAINKKTDRSL